MSERARHLAIDVLAFLFLAAIYLRLAIYNGPEASWDLRNYHLYTPFALLHGKASYDLYPASQHTFANPALDLPSYVARVALLDRPNILSCLLSLPTIISAFMAYRICLYMLPASARVRQPLALIATLLGATGIGTMGTLASTDSEAFPGMFTLAGLLCVVGAARECRGAWMHYTAGGALCGLAVGLKLTQMYCAVALVASVLLLSAATWRNRLPAAAAVALGCGAGAAITGGPWWLSLYLKFGNPIFPFFNNVFRSPFYPPVQISTEYLKPNGALETLFYPFYWAFEVQRRVWEGPNREPRFAVAYVAVVLAVLVALAARRWARAPGTEDSERSGKLVLGFFAIAFVVWEAQFSIYRYLFPLEMIAGRRCLSRYALGSQDGASAWPPTRRSPRWPACAGCGPFIQPRDAPSLPAPPRRQRCPAYTRVTWWSCSTAARCPSSPPSPTLASASSGRTTSLSTRIAQAPSAIRSRSQSAPRRIRSGVSKARRSSRGQPTPRSRSTSSSGPGRASQWTRT